MKVNYLLYVLITIISYACKDIVEPDISKKGVLINSPDDNLKTSQLTLTFWWKEVEGARGYNLQIVKGTFTGNPQLITDTNITGGEKYMQQFTPGAYQWRIRAYNNEYKTNYYSRSFTVDSALTLSGQTPTAILPLNNTYTKNPMVYFNWNELLNATEYRFEIYNMVDSVITDKLTQVDLTNANYTHTFASNDGKYAWRVQARNDNSLSNFSNYYYVNIKTSLPGNSTPINTDTVSLNSNLILNWNRSTSTAVYGDSVIIASDSLFTQNLYSVFTTGSTYTFNNSVLQSFSGNTYIYWRLRTVDKAGNASTLNLNTQRRKVKIN